MKPIYDYKIIDPLQQEFYGNMIYKEDLGNTQEKVVKQIYKDETGKKIDEDIYKGYEFYDKSTMKTYFILSEVVNEDKFPMRVKKTQEIEFRNKIYNIVTEYSHKKIKGKETMKGLQFFNDFIDLKHTKLTDFIVHKILTMTAFAGNGTIREVTKQGFGKGSFINMLIGYSHIGESMTISSKAKLEYNLKEPFLNLNEVAGLSEEDKLHWYNFLLSIGSRDPFYVKTTRAGAGTKEKYNLRELGVIITHNPHDYYLDKGIDPFETQFGSNIHYRFFPVLLEGSVDDDFATCGDYYKLLKENKEEVRDLLNHIYWIKNNYKHFKLTYDISRYNIDNPDKKEKANRWLLNFKDIARMTEYYAGTDKELFYVVMDEIYKAHKRYLDSIKDEEFY